jgi:hypothetical protein
MELTMTRCLANGLLWAKAETQLRQVQMEQRGQVAVQLLSQMLEMMLFMTAQNGLRWVKAET